MPGNPRGLAAHFTSRPWSNPNLQASGQTLQGLLIFRTTLGNRCACRDEEDCFLLGEANTEQWAAAAQESTPGDAAGHNPQFAILDVGRTFARSLDFPKSVRGSDFFVFGLIVVFHVSEGDIGLCRVASQRDEKKFETRYLRTD